MTNKDIYSNSLAADLEIKWIILDQLLFSIITKN